MGIFYIVGYVSIGLILFLLNIEDKRTNGKLKLFLSIFFWLPVMLHVSFYKIKHVFDNWDEYKKIIKNQWKKDTEKFRD